MSPDGKLKHISNHSGHYKPSLEDMGRALAFLRDGGVDISGATFKDMKFDQDQGNDQDATTLAKAYDGSKNLDRKYGISAKQKRAAEVTLEGVDEKVPGDSRTGRDQLDMLSSRQLNYLKDEVGISYDLLKGNKGYKAVLERLESQVKAIDSALELKKEDWEREWEKFKKL